MFTNFAEFFNCLKEGRFGFRYLWDLIVTLYYSITENPNIQVIWNGFMGVVRPIITVFMIVVIAVCIFGAFTGHKTLGVFKFLFFFVVGFALGVHLLAPVIPPVVKIPAWVIGLVVALVASVLYRFLYYGLYAVFIGHSIYYLCYNGFFLIHPPTFTVTRAIVCLVIAVGVVILAFALRKYVEMVGTAALGAWLAVLHFKWYIYNFTTWPFLVGREWLGILIFSLIIGVLGLMFQFKTRRRY